MAEIVVSAFLSVLFEKLGSAALQKVARYKGIDTEVKKWQRSLFQIREVLNDASQREITDSSVKQWLHGLQHLAYDIDDVLDELETEAMHCEFSDESTSITSKVRKLIPTCCTSFSVSAKMHDKFSHITTKLQELIDDKNNLGLNYVRDERRPININRRLQTSMVDVPSIVGRQVEKEALLHKLLVMGDELRHQNFSIVPIVGMGGLGKTTLARLLYDEKQVNDHFQLKAWVCVSDELDSFAISKVIFQSVTGESKEFADLNLLQVALRAHLTDKLFLLVLDDVWSESYEDWETLVGPFHACARGSKIIMTTRKEQLLKKLGYDHLNRLRSLSLDDALSLFAQHALGVNNFDSHPMLKPHGEGIVKKCNGLPLALKALGKVLRTKQYEEVYWQEVLDSEIWRLEDDGGIIPALRLSYNDLSARLKRLFAYCSSFPKDYMFDKEDLVLLWMAEGLLRQPPTNWTEERLGHVCFEELLSRSFFQHAPNESFFVMHDMMNDLATSVAGDFFLRLDNVTVKEEVLEKYRHNVTVEILNDQLVMRKRTHSAVSTHGDGLSNPKYCQEDRKQGDDHFPSSKKILLICLMFRMTNSLFVQTYFNPDEHWQALEVAHRVTFGYGHLTWEWKKGIRSYLHPMLFAVLYKVLSVFHLDTQFFMIKAPRLLQSMLSAFGDLYLFKLSHTAFGYHVAQWALFSQLTNWFMFYCITRTLSNSLETVLTVISLYYWPCLRVNSSNALTVSRPKALVAAAIVCAIRPTSAIIWVYVGLMELFVSRDRLKFVFLEVLPIGFVVLGLTFLLDRLMYGSWVFVPLNFLKFNFLSSGGDYYGTHPWHWYFSQGFTVMIFSFLPFMVVGIIQSKNWKLSGLILWVLALYSVLGHKEFRFVLPVLPIALAFSGYSLVTLSRPYSSGKMNKKITNTQAKCSWKIQAAVFFLLVTNVPMSIYMSMVHQRGAEDVMNYLAKEAYHGSVKNILFLTPCHATPYYSTLHQRIPMRFLDCSPSEVKGSLDESDQFLMNPFGFISEFAKNWSQPSHIILFDNEEKHLTDFLFSNSYVERKRFFHSHFKVDRDLQASVVVYELLEQ